MTLIIKLSLLMLALLRQVGLRVAVAVLIHLVACLGLLEQLKGPFEFALSDAAELFDVAFSFGLPGREYSVGLELLGTVSAGIRGHAVEGVFRVRDLLRVRLRQEGRRV